MGMNEFPESKMTNQPATSSHLPGSQSAECLHLRTSVPPPCKGWGCHWQGHNQNGTLQKPVKTRMRVIQSEIVYIKVTILLENW